MPQPPYSPDLPPCEFFSFQKAKSAVKGHHFESTEDIQRSVPQALRHSSSCVPGMLQTVAAPLENMCAGTRDVLWRWPYFIWWINKIKLFFGTSLITLLSDLVIIVWNLTKEDLKDQCWSNLTSKVLVWTDKITILFEHQCSYWKTSSCLLCNTLNTRQHG